MYTGGAPVNIVILNCTWVYRKKPFTNCSLFNGDGATMRLSVEKYTLLSVLEDDTKNYIRQ